MTTRTPTRGQHASGAPGPRADRPVLQDTAPRHTDAVRSLTAEVARLQRDLETVTERSRNLQAALESNRRIGMAVGNLLATRRLTDEAAFECLRRVGNVRNVELRLVAEEVVHRGVLEQPPALSGSAARPARRPWTPRRGSPAGGRAPSRCSGPGRPSAAR